MKRTVQQEREAGGVGKGILPRGKGGLKKPGRGKRGGSRKKKVVEAEKPHFAKIVEGEEASTIRNKPG